MSRGSRILRYLGVPSKEEKNWKLECINPSGDCFYEAVEKAFLSKYDLRPRKKQKIESTDEVQVNLPTVDEMRAIVASCADENLLESYKVYHDSGISGYEFMRNVTDLEHLQNKIMTSG